MATGPALLAGPPVAVGRGDDLRRPARPPGGRDEPGRRPAVDSLARTDRLRDAGGRQRVLHGLPVHGAADVRKALASSGPELAELAAQQMAGGLFTRQLPVGL